MSNFFINQIRACGPGKADSILEFKEGLNVVSGPSNTGKTYVFEFIKFMLGSSQDPRKDIEEAQGYSSGYLELNVLNQIITLERSLKGGDFKAYNASITDLLNSSKNISGISLKSDTTGKNNISSYLLDKLNLDNREIIRGLEKGEKGIIRLSDFRSILMADETSIISKNSPFLSGEYSRETREKTFLNYLLTGESYNDVILTNDKKAIENTKSKIDFLKENILEDTRRVDRLKGKLDALNVGDPHLLKNEISGILNEVNGLKYSLDDNLKNKAQKSIELQSVKSKVIALTELQSRFNLLDEQYTVDIERLENLIEVHQVFKEMKPVICPHCGQEMSSTAYHLHTGKFDLKKHQGSIISEATKIRNLKRDLADSRKDILSELNQRAQRSESLSSEIKSIDLKIQEFNGSIKQFNDRLQALRDNELDIRNLEFLNGEISKKNEKLKRMEAGVKQTKRDSSKRTNLLNLNNFALNKYLDEASRLFKQINFHKDNVVTFDSEKIDLSIGGKSRDSFGKGYRAIASSVALLALLMLRKQTETLPEFLVLDSPLTTFEGERIKGKAAEIEISKEMQNSFFKLFSDQAKNIQVIIFDNKRPEEQEVIDNINYTEFTKNLTVGRYGFFPVT